MHIKITDDCVTCGACEAINPKIFSIETTNAKVDEKFIKGNEQDCIDAALICPVNAIWIDDISN